jgi:hypothetical protein
VADRDDPHPEGHDAARGRAELAAALNGVAKLNPMPVRRPGCWGKEITSAQVLYAERLTVTGEGAGFWDRVVILGHICRPTSWHMRCS